jgi:hypothetical protein
LALEVEYMSQHLSTKGVLEYHTFDYEGKQKKIELQHLCLTTCTAILLKYYEVKLNGADIGIRDVAESATRVFLDVQTGKIPKPQGFEKVLDEKADPIVKFTDGSYPYNLEFFIFEGTERLLKAAGFTKKHWASSDTENLLLSNWPDLKLYLGLGWPTILADKLKGSFEHTRICTGLAVDHTGKIVECYVIDPGHEDRLTINLDGSQSDLGWILFCAETDQSDVSPKRLLGGGSLPATRRMMGF